MATNGINGQRLLQTYDSATKRWGENQNKELKKETSFGVLGLSIPKPGFMVDDKAVQKIQERYARMEELLGQIMQQVAKMMEQQTNAGRAQQ